MTTNPTLFYLLDLIRELHDPDPCWLDHNGTCQAHNQVGPHPCPHKRAQVLLEGMPS